MVDLLFLFAFRKKKFPILDWKSIGYEAYLKGLSLPCSHFWWETYGPLSEGTLLELIWFIPGVFPEAYEDSGWECLEGCVMWKTREPRFIWCSQLTFRGLPSRSGCKPQLHGGRVKLWTCGGQRLGWEKSLIGKWIPHRPPCHFLLAGKFCHLGRMGLSWSWTHHWA